MIPNRITHKVQTESFVIPCVDAYRVHVAYLLSNTGSQMIPKPIKNDPVLYME